ncbi:fumarylacetoacetate hydrolase family protein [Rhizobium sp. S152]|uniref:fumarylacetoacetate hydrolase family protein n=1 Tax=Rhizobium sp. S152 TaxID=3055038 RepID=UPI0025A94FBB|nr:fumarylacetoacetate hydrolase family protein [Rhizobium sp. S152]MDM9627561.1 fumarylacetoacetate hydrolase family protein [Rhizobium sp. S152]
MKLARYGAAGAERPALVDGNGKLRDISIFAPDILPEVLSDESLKALAELDIDRLPVVDDANVRLGPPVSSIGKIICIGLNYTDHAAEVGLPLPKEPTIFMKGCRPSGSTDLVRLPRQSEKGDWEVELGIIIGKGGLYISPEDALAHVAGYCVVNDLSERSYQMDRGGQWTKGKSFPGFAPVGPWLVTKDEVENVGELPIWLEVNGHRYQDGNTSNLVFGVREIVSYVSNFYALEPGDLIATGTPAGVGLGQKPPVFLRPGDVVTLGIDGLGAQRQEIVAWEA